MLSRVLTCRTPSVLALAAMLLWASHALLGATGGQGWAASAGDHLHGHAHEDVRIELVCALCWDHPHSPLTVDHLHETPHLGAWPPAPLPAQEPRPAVSALQRLPDGPRTRIERPPRG